MSLGNLHSDWSALFLRAFVASGVERIVLSPGSRSTPLALAAAREDGLSKHVMIDERVAAFFALGQARLTQKPSLLLCTSGTAVAHYLPAIIEANLTQTPMIVITADRPWEAYDNASSQTIDQVKVFGDHVQWYAELGLPDAAPEALRAVPRIAAQATMRSLGGPVHINARFRKPLEPVARGEEPWRPEIERLFAQGAPRYYPTQREASKEAIEALAEILQRSSKTLFVCGPALRERAGKEVLSLAKRLNAPIFAEASSGLRFGKSDDALICGAFDSFLRAKALRAQIKPEVIVSFGMPSVSSSYNLWLAESPDIYSVVVSPGQWSDPNNTARMMIAGEPESLAERLNSVAAKKNNPEWVEVIKRAEETSWSKTRQALSDEKWSEGSIARALIEGLPAESVLLLGNSNPIRDVDTYCEPQEKKLTILHQRGASGIDGLLAGAAGAKSATHQPVALLVGDISFLHDVSGLNALRSVDGPLLVVVVQNNGGRIFAQLPLGKKDDLRESIERYFATPQDISLEHFAAGFSLSYAKVDGGEALSLAIQTALRDKQKIIIEAVVPETAGTTQRNQLWSKISEAVRGLR
jgi:2-succinyl-5-enolpyruvyl-6-hydroxy-3-cyclohexene-1-carboxylate synthase